MQMLGRQEDRCLQFWETCQFRNHLHVCDGHYQEWKRDPGKRKRRVVGKSQILESRDRQLRKCPQKSPRLKGPSRDDVTKAKQIATKETV